MDVALEALKMGLGKGVKAKLLNLAHAQKSDIQQLLMRYALERLLSRLEQQLVLKPCILIPIRIILR